MSELQSAPDLHALDERYEILGELRGSVSARRYIARRRADRADVMVTVVTAAGGGENNALAHFASDTQTLTGLNHPRIPRLLEGRWVGAEAFAVVSERVRGATMHEVLSAGERFPNPRIATVLHEVNEVLKWARTHGIVHRGVTPDSLYFEQDTDSLHVALELTPIPLEGLPDERSDGQTIGALAWAMLTGRRYADGTPESLSELRPDLAKRVVDETTSLVTSAGIGDVPDVEQFLSVIAMGDVLRQGEIEVARLQAEIIEERRIERVRLEAEARAHADRAAAMEEQLRRERAEFARQVAEQTARLRSDGQQVDVERVQLEQERLEFTRRVAELERKRADLERLGDNPPPVPTLDPDRLDDELLRGGNPRGWMIPVATVAMLLMLIFVGALMARHGTTAPRAITIGGSTVVPTAGSPENPGFVPRGGFLTQSAGGELRRMARVDSSASARDTSARRDSASIRDSLARDSLSRDTLARRDSVARRDTVPPDTARARPDMLTFP